jgi:signal transduction histidine kinase
MSRSPIRIRVTAAFALAMAVVLVGTGAYLYVRLSSHLSLALDRQLQQRAQDLGALVTQPGASLSRDTGGRFVESGESYAELVDSRNNVLEATPTLGKQPILTAAEVAAARRNPIYVNRASTPGLDEGSRALATEVTRNGKAFVLVVGSTRQNNAETLHSFRTELLVAGPVALVLASLVGYLLASLSLRQVESMRRRAATISAETPGERLPVPETGDELERLGTTLNEMLGRLETALEREREFVADAGHELRTPLALLRTELELALRQGTTVDELRDAILMSSREADRLSQLAEDLLLIASADRGRLPLRRERVNVDELFGGIVTRFELQARESAKSVRAVPTQGLTVDGDPLRLQQALGNLVDNALRYGGNAIRLEADEQGLHVRDDGPGFAPGFLPRAFERFSRGDGARGVGGAGLGLSIVHAIAEAHGGSAHVMNVNGGADAWFSLGR